jgi:hypothetical protein
VAVFAPRTGATSLVYGALVPLGRRA